jgi:MFS family permease
MRWRIVPLLMVFVGLAHFNRVSISVAGAEQIIRPDFIADWQMGLVYSAFLLWYTVFMIPGGRFIDRFGPRAAWMVVGFASAAGAALTGAAGLVFAAPAALLLALLAVRSLMGLGNAPLHPSAARLVANWVPAHGTVLANGLVCGAACVGMASAYPGFASLMDAFGWPGAFLAAGGVTLVVSLVWTMLASDNPPELARLQKRPERPEPTSSARMPFSRLLAHKGLLCLTLSYAMVGYFQYLFYYWAQYYFEQVLHLPKEVGRRNASLLTLAMGAGMAVGGWLSDRAVAAWGSRRGLAAVPVTGLVLAAGATVLGAFAPDPTVVVASFATAMAAVGLGEGAFWETSVRIGGTRGGSAAGILNTGGNAGGLLAPTLTPLISAHFGWQAGLAVASGVCLVGAALWWGVGSADCLEEPSQGVACAP